MATFDDLRGVLEARLAELDEEATHLQRILEVMEGKDGRRRAGATRARAGRASSAAGPTGRTPRRGAGDRPGRLEQVLEEFRRDPAARSKDVAARLGIAPSAVSGMKSEAKKRGLAEEGVGGELIVRESTPGGDGAPKTKGESAPVRQKGSGQKERRSTGKRRRPKANREKGAAAKA